MKCFDCPYFSFGVNIKAYIRMWAHILYICILIMQQKMLNNGARRKCVIIMFDLIRFYLKEKEMISIVNARNLLKYCYYVYNI